MRIIDYLNQGRYLKRVTDQQPAIQGHVNYVIEQLAGSGAVDITPTDSLAVVTAYIPVDSNADTFTIDISKLDSSVTELNIDVKDFVFNGGLNYFSYVPLHLFDNLLIHPFHFWHY